VPTVLVVDDEAILCELYEQELGHVGYEVITALSGAEALTVLAQQQIDVVVLDIAMPGMDGVEMLRRILAINNRLPVILNTAYGSYQDDFMTWAAESYVVKSGDLSELVGKLAAALESRGVQPPGGPQEQDEKPERGV
jgi:CheY-like chemotaxis protein